MKVFSILLALCSITVTARGQIDTHPPNHKEYVEQMRLPYFLFAEDFRELVLRDSEIRVTTERGQRLLIRRWGGGFVSETDDSPRRKVAEYSPFVSMTGEWSWVVRYEDMTSRTIRRDEARKYTDAGDGRFTRR